MIERLKRKRALALIACMSRVWCGEEVFLDAGGGGAAGGAVAKGDSGFWGAGERVGADIARY